MAQFPPLAVQICTYNRWDELNETMSMLLHNIQYRGDVVYVISDDSTGNGYLESFYDKWKDHPGHNGLHCVSTRERGGWGLNVNGGLNFIRDTLGLRYVYFTEDDYVPLERLYLTPGVALMECNKAVGLMRYDGVAGHPLLAELLEYDISAYLPDYIHGIGSLPGRLHYWNLLFGSTHLNIYSNRPHLKHLRFHDYYGLYMEGYKLGATEEEFAHRYRNHMQQPGAPRIVTLPEYVKRIIKDIGSSFQFTEHDTGAELS